MISRIGFVDALAGAREMFSGAGHVKSQARWLVVQALASSLFLSLIFSNLVFAAESNGDLPIWLVKNNWRHNKGLPKNFRKMHDSIEDIGKAMAKGLDSVNASGSAQYSKENLEAIKTAIGAFKITVLDLRQESHGFINDDLPVSWFQGQDQLNWGKSLPEIEADESKRLDDLKEGKTAAIYELVKPANSPNAMKTGADPEKVDIKSALPESKICKQEHLSYIRIPVADYHPPADEYVDQFVKMAKAVAANEWLHMHCEGGDGRTTTFLAMYDMMHNADKVSFDDIIERQQKLGGIDLLQTSGKQDWKIPYMQARAKFIREFYSYCVEQIPRKFTNSWSEWKKTKK